MSKYQMVPASEEHALELARNIRKEDAAELWASAKETPTRAILKSVKRSEECLAGLVDGRVVCVFGVVPYSFLSNTGIIWMLATPELEVHARAFLRRNKTWIAGVRQKFPRLINVVDARNTVAVKWLKWLGFTVKEPMPMGPFRLPFHSFEMRTEPCVIQQP